MIRHGQSTLNIAPAVAVADSASVPLTEDGMVQARQASRSIPFEPEMIVSSPFLRAIQTAEPIRERFPNAGWEIWDELHEFVYLSPASCVGTTREERRPRSREYWRKTDADLIDGEGAESFRMLMNRAEIVEKRLRHRKENRIILVSHEQFIKAFLLMLHGYDEDITKTMRRFKKTPAVGNCEAVPLEIS